MLKVIVGVVFLLFAFALSYASYSNGGAMIAKQDALVMKYVNASDSALSSKDIKGAIKYAKMAIEANPKSKKAYICYNNAMVAKYKPVSQAGTTSNTPAPAPAQSSDDSALLGC